MSSSWNESARWVDHLKFPPVPASRFLVAPVVVTALIAAGCGGDSGGGNSKALLEIAQANADVNEFCSVSGSSGAIYDAAYFSARDAVQTLATGYKQHRNDKVNLDQRNHDVPVQKVVQDAIAKLGKGCGKDGKLQAAKLQRAISKQ